jgi:hypothetical protein
VKCESCLRPSQRDLRRSVVGDAFEPKLRARPITFRDVEVGEGEQRFASRLAPALGDGQSPHVGLSGVGRSLVHGFADASEPHPNIRPRRNASGELFERERQLGVKTTELACIGEQCEADGRTGHFCQERVGLGASAHGFPRGERGLTVFQVAFGAGEGDLDPTHPSFDRFGELHGTDDSSGGWNGRRLGAWCGFASLVVAIFSR